MSIVKVIEVISEGNNLEAAMQAAVTEATKTVKHVQQVNVEHIEGIVTDNKVTKYRIHAKVSFVVEHSH
ncbi:MAG: dodecin family protein [Parachlamydiaceae bacterium]